ncbi:hypothetical protein VTJ04DRAFT_405 [Mycothermus thermophilus]|uniref:uncharacterized protein n=1 Tax=Humicola insolens TaxID=85995 RepID=UPI003743061C
MLRLYSKLGYSSGTSNSLTLRTRAECCTSSTWRFAPSASQPTPRPNPYPFPAKPWQPTRNPPPSQI